MLDTSNIPIEELPEAMYNESMKSFGDAVSNSYGIVSFNIQAVEAASEVFEDAMSRKDYTEAYRDITNLISCIRSLQESCIKMQGILRCKPKKP